MPKTRSASKAVEVMMAVVLMTRGGRRIKGTGG
jgi:hypothetical protein